MALRALILLTLTAAAQVQTAGAEITASPEIEVPGLPDIAVTIRDPASPTGRVILIEPERCAAAGAACRFLILHEHGHAALGHDPRMPSRMREREADAFAAARAPAAAVLAAWDWIRRGPDLPLYGSGAARAEALCQAARAVGNWIGPPCG